MFLMDRNKKNLHKVKANVLGLTLVSVMAVGAAGEAATPVPVYAADSKVQTDSGKTAVTIYLNGTLGTEADKQDGSSKDKAVASLDRALALAGSSGTVLVCGQVTVSSEKNLTIPGGVQIKKADGHTGPLIKVTGKGKLTVTGSGLQASDVDTTGAEAGSKAFVVNKGQEDKNETGSSDGDSQTTEPSGTGDVPGTDDSKEPAPTPDPGEGSPSGGDQDNTDTSTGGDGTDKTEGADDPDDVSGGENGNPQKPKGTVEMPDTVTLKSPEQWKGFDFAGAGFKGEGTFTWESDQGPETYESQRKVIFTPKDAQALDYSQIEGWNADTKTVEKVLKVTVESLKTPDEEKDPEDTGTADKDTGNGSSETGGSSHETEDGTESDKETADKEDIDKEETEEEDKESQEPSKEDNEQEDADAPSGSSGEEEQETVEEQPEATEGKTGEEATELPQDIIPVGSLLDEDTGIRVSGDFIPFYVDLQVSYNDQLSQLPEAGIGDILSAYEICLWDLKEDQEYLVPEGKKVKVMIPLPENAEAFSQISVAHYLASCQYEYFVLGSEESPGNMTIETIDGIQYLTFETSSFSPFNVGGSQLVGPGSQDKTEGGTSSGSLSGGQQSGTTQNSTSQGQVTGNSGNSGNKSNVSTGSAVKNSTKTRVIRTVKTGDESPVLIYVAAGAVAIVLAVLAFLMGKKRK